MHCHGFAPVALASLVLLGTPAQAISLGTSNTFQDDLTAGWTSGTANPTPPLVVATGGPSGAGDKYLLLQSSGVAQAGAKLNAWSTGAQWEGNYTAAGVTALGMDVNNLGNTGLSLRLYLIGATGPTAVSSNAVSVPAGGGWTHVNFALNTGALTGSPPAALADLTEFRLFQSISASYPPTENITATLGIDNVTAVPEPGNALMLGVGLAALTAAFKTRRRRAP